MKLERYGFGFRLSVDLYIGWFNDKCAYVGFSNDRGEDIGYWKYEGNEKFYI